MPPQHDRTAALSLPSFAQAFSSLSSSSSDRDDRALPPIHGHGHHRHSPSRQGRTSPAPPRSAVHHRPGPPSSKNFQQNMGSHNANSRKRQRAPSVNEEREGYDSSDRSSPRPDIVKEEQEQDQLGPSPSPSPAPQSQPPPPRLKSSQSSAATPPPPPSQLRTTRHDLATINTTLVSGATPPPSLARPLPPTKRRRVTISGGAHPLSMSNLPTADRDSRTPTRIQTQGVGGLTGPSTPISPVVMGFVVPPDDSAAIDQVRAMRTIKQQQKALIEQRRGSIVGSDGRRGSTAGLERRGSVPSLHPVITPSVNIVNPTPTSATAPNAHPPGSAAAPGPPPKRSSPNGGHRMGPSPPSMSVPVNAPTTRSPNSSARSSPHMPANGVKPIGTSNSSARPISPSAHVVPSQNPRSYPPPGPPSNASFPNRSPPTSQHQHAHTGPGQAPSHQHSSHIHPGPAPPAQHQHQSQPQQAQQLVATQGLSALANNLPPPPNSFARRRASQLGMRGNKPADIVISPRDSDGSGPSTNASANTNVGGAVNERAGPRIPTLSNSYKALQPAIQSAPAVPRHGQQPGHFPMALPSLPPTINQRGVALRRAPGQVPPTPTRLSMQRAQGTGETTSVRLSQPTGVPPLPGTGPLGAHPTMPATPATRHHAVNTSADKQAFLAPFEHFYDALSDARVLKGWFSEQLRRVGSVVKDVEAVRAELDKARVDLERQREDASVSARMGAGGAGAGLMRGEIERLVAEAVQQEARAWKDEVTWLRGRVHELEETVRGPRLEGKSASRVIEANSTDGPQRGVPPPSSTGDSGGSRQGPFPVAPGADSYTFPPVQPLQSLPLPGTESIHRSPSPLRFGTTDFRSASRSAASSPAPSVDSGVGGNVRRLSVSAMRFEPPSRPPVDVQASEQKPNVSQARKADDRPGSEGGISRKGTGDAERPELPRHNSHGGAVSLKTEKTETKSGHSRKPSNGGRRSPALSSSPPKRPESPMDES